METVKQWVNGELYEGSPAGTIAIENPGTGKVIGEALVASKKDLEYTVQIAKEAQKNWGALSLARRTEVMFKMRSLVLENQDRIAEAIVEEHGKNFSDAIGEIQRGRETLDYVCGISNALKGEFTLDASTGVDVHSMRQPLGVAAGVCPFNFPAMVPMWMHPVAIATGNAFIVKPAATTPTASIIMGELYKEAGLPDGIYNVLNGDVDLVNDILEDPGIAAISFVGSTPVAKIIQSKAVENGKRVQALGGANNHGIVMPDADLDFTAAHLSAAAFGAAGERCMALPVVVAVGGIGEKLAQKVAENAKQIKVGYGMGEGVEMGPVITAAAKDRITGLIDDAEERGATVVLDGRTLEIDGYESGHFLGPTILTGVPLDAPAYKDEVFGPVLAVVEVDTYEEAIQIVNSSPFGNGTAIFTNDGGIARRFSIDVEAGMVGINVPIPTPVAYYSFGGWKDSIMADTNIHGPEGVRFYTRAKVVTSRWPSEAGADKATMSFKRSE